MEPRPTSSRSSQGQPPAGAGRGPEDTGSFQQQPDPTTVVAPQRSDYDYSPLDLAPPGQRRRRQLVAALIGGVVLLLLIAAAVFAVLALTGDDDGDGDVAELQAQIATLQASSNSTPDADDPSLALADGEGDATEPAASDDETDPAATETDGETDAAADTGEQVVASQPTEPPANAGTGALSPAELEGLLPESGIMPQGLDAISDTSRTEEEVVAALGGNREAETNLNTWGWVANVERSFTAADPAALAPDATTDITVSLHGFADAESAAAALTFYSDILANSGYEEVEAGDIGATNRMLRQPQEDGGTTVALYVQEGSVLYRIGGYSPAGDPTTNVINVARTMLSG